MPLEDISAEVKTPPWHIEQRDAEYCVVADETDEVMGCHATEEEAQQQVEALYANAEEEAQEKALVTALADPRSQTFLQEVLGDGYEAFRASLHAPLERIEEADDDRPIAFGGAVKALGDGRVGGYLVQFGDDSARDLTGEYFDKDTDFAFDDYPVKGERVFYHHGLDKKLKDKVLARIGELNIDDIGLWIESQLNMRDEYERAIYEKLAAKGKLGWSSGALPQSVVTEPNGRIARWHIIEGSMTPTPAEYRQTKVVTLKAIKAMALEDLIEPPETDTTESAPPVTEEVKAIAARSWEDVLKSVPFNPMQEHTKMDPQMIVAIVRKVGEVLNVQLSDEQITAIVEKINGSMADNEAAQMADQQAVASLVAEEAAKAIVVVRDTRVTEAATEAATAIKRAALARAPGGYSRNGGRQQVSVGHTYTKYHELSSEDMSMWVSIVNARRQAAKQPFWTPDNEFLGEFAAKTMKSFEAGEIKLEKRLVDNWNGQAQYTYPALKSLNAWKANELDHSTQTGFGDEWVPDHWSNQVWEKARLDNVVFPLFQSVDMPTNPFELPVEGADPTVFFVPETTDETALTLAGSTSPIPDSKLATAKVQLTAKKLGLRTMLSSETDEDSIIPFIPQLRGQAIRALEDAIDNVLINGDNDTTASTNINLIDGTPGANDKYLVFDGLRLLPLVTNTANSKDGLATAVTLQQLRDIRFLMAGNYANRPRDLAYITHTEVHPKALAMPEFLTLDKYGPAATIMNGELGKVDGIPFLISAELAKTNAAGKIPAGGGTLGSVLCVYRPGWKVGFRRRVNSSIDYLPYYDIYVLSATLRLAFMNRDTEVASILFNSFV